jgi:hypothetical protein
MVRRRTSTFSPCVFAVEDVMKGPAAHARRSRPYPPGNGTAGLPGKTEMAYLDRHELFGSA